MKLTLFITLLSGVFPFLLFGQVNHGYFEVLASDDGLSENHVNCIYQDATGFMWFGTFDGLNRYDGYNLEAFKPDPNDANTISGILIYALTGDRRGNLWIGTTGTGLNRYNPDTELFQRFKHAPDNPGSVGSDFIQSLLVDRYNRLWVGTDKGVSCLRLDDWEDDEEAAFIQLELEKELSVNVIFEDKDGRIWLGTNTGLYLIENREAQPRLVTVLEGEELRTINAITEAPEGGIIVGGSFGLFQQIPPGGDGIVFRRISERGAENLTIDSTRLNIWVGTRNGLEVYGIGNGGEPLVLKTRFEHKTANENSISTNTIEDLYTDRAGHIWIGTFGGGVNQYNPDRKNFHQLEQCDVPSELAGNGIRALYQTEDKRLWIGTVGGGLLVADTALRPKVQPRFTKMDGPERIYAVHEVRNASGHYLYVGTDVGPGLYRMDLSEEVPTSEPVHSLENTVMSIMEDSRNRLWFGTYAGGLHLWTPNPSSAGGYDKKIFLPGGEGAIPSPIVRSLLEDRRGNIWIGTGDGLAMLTAREVMTEKPVFQVYRNVEGDETSLSQNYILPLFESEAGTIWIGTFGGGLNRFVPANEGKAAYFQQITEHDGLPNGVIKSILEDGEGQLWVTSNKGIMKYYPESDRIQSFDRSDGLRSNEFQELAGYRQSNGLMVYGGVNGLDFFYPHEIEDGKAGLQPVLTHLEISHAPVIPGRKYKSRQVLEKRLSQTDHIELRHSENSISLEFAALDYATPEKTRFAYKLEGFNEDWVYLTANQRRATYTNLPCRDFTFLVKAENSDGIWSDEPTRLDISISPPFYLAWYAYIFYGLLVLGVLYAFRRYSLIEVEEKNRLVIENVSREKMRELNQLKLQFFTNISHEFRTPLTLIIGPLETMIQSGGALTEENRRNYQHLMYKNAKYLLRLVNQLLDFRKLDQGLMPLQVSKRDIVDFIREITGPFEFMANKKGVEYIVSAEEEPITLWFDPDVLEKVVYNLLANAFKFTPPGGRVEINIRKDVSASSGFGSVMLTVSDTGAGIARKHVKRIFDRFYKSSADKALNREGAGIGLAYTKSLLDLHHSQISVRSKVGEGTTFQVQLSLDKSIYAKDEFQTGATTTYLSQSDPLDYVLPETEYQPVETNLPQATLAPGAHIVRQGEDESPLLLYIDDNADLRDFIRSSMAADFRVMAADGGMAGLELAKTSLPDIVITDLMMPEVDGMQVLQKLKEDPSTSHIPVIMLTAKSTMEARIEGVGYGADGYVTKPFNVELLRQQIINIIQRREVLHDRFRREVITSPKEVTVTNADEEFLQRAMAIVEENMSNTEFSVEQLVKEMRVSRSKLYLKLKALTGQSSSEFVRTVRLKRAVQLLENSGYSVKEVMFMTGFNTASYFSKCFRQQFGIVPSEYIKSRKKAAAEGEA